MQDELRDLRMVPGMSTTQVADSISGRGVGLDVVKRAVERLRGAIRVDSTPGVGTTFALSLPLTLASHRGLFIVSGRERFVVPQAAVQCVRVFGLDAVTVTDRVSNLWHNGRHIPIARLGPELALERFAPTEADPGGPPPRYVALVLSSAESVAAVVVDDVESEAEIVVRSLGSFVQRMPKVSGLTTTASGEMYFVLDPVDLIRGVFAPEPDVVRDGAIARESDAREPVVLVVDDSVTSRAFNQRILVGSGYRVILARHGREALVILSQQPCDLVLSDVQMPHVDGLELARQIKCDVRLARLPVVLLTSLDGDDERARGIEAGADAYLVKRDLLPAGLLSVIEELI